MGLDMYLQAQKYVSGYSHSSADERAQYDRIIRESLGTDYRCDDSPSLTVSVTVAYWRKANQIHRWFVHNCQDGNDDCRDAYVSREQIRALIVLCQEVLDGVESVEGDVSTGTRYHPDGKIEALTERGHIIAQVGIAEAKLPTQSGFFFGNTDYDEFYLRALQHTIKQLEAVLDNPAFEGCSFYYHSSW